MSPLKPAGEFLEAAAASAAAVSPSAVSNLWQPLKPNTCCDVTDRGVVTHSPNAELASLGV